MNPRRHLLIAQIRIFDLFTFLEVSGNEILMVSNVRLVLLFLKFQNLRDFKNFVCFSFLLIVKN